MKKALVLIALTLGTVATAQADRSLPYSHKGQVVQLPHSHSHGRWERHNGRWEWIVPVTFLTGIIVANEINRQNNQSTQVQPVPQPNTVYIDRTIITQPQPPLYCGAWREVQDSNGTIYRERTCRE